ncbi:hypothetical protein BV25DRAFT_1325945 [Artomyces pyxidatus]|uniref:Uncharacterized protein n=1 Tax=Artomyces pyxidatus TaxID=48021 RepID=A0ACB8SP41_9AGAM|nr:hypothetical protein BV25DRAFT_1325945 [Artomyces pyxidatus]
MKIRKQERQPTRRGMLIRLDAARFALKDSSGHEETDETLWKRWIDKDIRSHIRQLTCISRALHRMQKLSKYWENIPGMEYRALCPTCSYVEESLDRILYDCDDPSHESIDVWKLAEELCPW